MLGLKEGIIEKVKENAGIVELNVEWVDVMGGGKDDYTFIFCMVVIGWVYFFIAILLNIFVFIL